MFFVCIRWPRGFKKSLKVIDIKAQKQKVEGRFVVNIYLNLISLAVVFLGWVNEERVVKTT